MSKELSITLSVVFAALALGVAYIRPEPLVVFLAGWAFGESLERARRAWLSNQPQTSV
jgi:hypothetical protein